MAEDKNISQINMRIPGMKGGPRNRGAAVEKPVNGKETFMRLMQYFAKEIPVIIALFIAVVVMVVCSVYAPKLQSQAIDYISLRKFNNLNHILIFMLVVYIIYSICTFIQTRLSAILSQRIVKHIDQHSHGDIMSRMTNDVENISNTVSQSMSSLFSGVLTIIGTVIMMVALSPQLALCSCTTVILTIFATKNLSKAMRKFYSRRQVLLGQLNGTVEEMVTGIKTVTAFDRQENVCSDFNNTSDELTKVGIKAEILGGSMGPVMNVINNIGFVIIAGAGGYFAIKGYVSIGVISAFIVYAKQFGRPIDELANIWGQIQTAIAGAERVFAVLDEPSEDKSGEFTMDNSTGNIEFNHVDFSYIQGKQVLHDFNLKVKAGQKVALVGSTGSGKTTVVNLLMRFYDIDNGSITIDGVNIKDIDCENLRKNTAIVLQDTVLFADTVKNNLLYSRQDATDTEIIAAAKKANCHNMIMHLPDGYDSMLAKDGQNLSQGQRQLLSIARAFVASPKILILDEATSSVDTRTEKKIQDAMTNLMKNRTSLIIAHRLSTIQDADVIVVMDNGRVVETGNHESLLAAKGRYYELYMTQFAGKAI